MRRSLQTFLLAVIVMFPAAASAAPVEINTSPTLIPAVGSDLDVSLRLIGGKGAVLMPGRDINLTFQTSSDAYVIIYNIDSEGYVHLLYPIDGRPRMIDGKKIHFLPEQGNGTSWEVGGDTGIEYIHAIAVGDPSRIDRDELYYLAQNSTMPEERRLRIDMDPFLAFNMIDEELIGEADRISPATDYTYFYINRRVEYPGYLCYKCHSPSNLPDPYEMECPEVDIELIAANEDAGYPYPQLYAVIHAGTDSEDEYESHTYYADNLSLGYDEYEYDESKVYLSVYYNHGYYPYSYYWPGYWSWYVNWSPYSSWNITWGIGWGGCYYHHYPFYSWYPYSYYSYWSGYQTGYWDGYYGSYYPVYYTSADSRSLYASRSFTKRSTLDYTSTKVKTSRDTALGGRTFDKRTSLDYASTRVKTSREETLASSRLVDERRQTSKVRSYQRSRLARRTTREQGSTGFRTFDTNRYNTGSSTGIKRGVYGNYGSTRSARSTQQAGTERTKSRNSSSYKEGSVRTERNRVNTKKGSRGTSTRSSTGIGNIGSEIERRFKSHSRENETKTRKTEEKRTNSPNSQGTRKKSSATRSGTSARSSKSSDKGKESGKSSGSNRGTSTRRSSGKSSPSGGTSKSSGNRSSSGSSSGRSSSGKSRRR